MGYCGSTSRRGLQPAELSDEQVQRAVGKLNHRPCEVLGYRTPHEVFFGGGIALPQAASSCWTSILNPRHE